MTTLERSLLIKGLSGPIKTIPLVEKNLIDLGYFEKIGGSLVITADGVEAANLELTEIEDADSVTLVANWRILIEVVNTRYQRPSLIFREAVERAEVSRASALVGTYALMRERYPDASFSTIEVLNIAPPKSDLFYDWY